jgi:hypothetical protein
MPKHSTQKGNPHKAPVSTTDSTGLCPAPIAEVPAELRALEDVEMLCPVFLPEQFAGHADVGMVSMRMADLAWNTQPAERMSEAIDEFALPKGRQI